MSQQTGPGDPDVWPLLLLAAVIVVMIFGVVLFM
jgi:hypothetical protein